MPPPLPRPKARLYVTAALAGRQPVGVEPAQAHYLRTVLRLEAGDPVALFNGRDGEWLARIGGLGKGWGSLDPQQQTRPQLASPDLWLCFAPIKRGRIDFVVEKATELGVSVLQPVFTRHTDAARINPDRLRANIVEAAEQCERLDLPELREAVTLPALLQSWPAERALVVCAEAGPVRPIAEAAAVLAGRKAALLVGPEGGFAKSELDALADLPFAHAVGLGPRILRADTAALAALACWQSLAGDGRDRPPNRPA